MNSRSVTTAKDFKDVYAATGELPDLSIADHHKDLANVLLQIDLNIFDPTHYIPLAKRMLEAGYPQDFTDPALMRAVYESVSQILGVAMMIDLKITDKMLMYYAAKTAEDLQLGDATVGSDYTDDWFVSTLYKLAKEKAKTYNCWSLSIADQVSLIDEEITSIIAKREALDSEMRRLANKRDKLIAEAASQVQAEYQSTQIC